MLREDQHSACFHALPVNHGLCADACPHLRPDRVVVGPGVIGGDAAAEHREPAHDDPVERVLVANGRAPVAGMAVERVHETAPVERVEHGKMAERSAVEIACDDDRLVWRGDRVFVGPDVGELLLTECVVFAALDMCVVDTHASGVGAQRHARAAPRLNGACPPAQSGLVRERDHARRGDRISAQNRLTGQRGGIGATLSDLLEFASEQPVHLQALGQPLRDIPKPAAPAPEVHFLEQTHVGFERRQHVGMPLAFATVRDVPRNQGERVCDRGSGHPIGLTRDAMNLVVAQRGLGEEAGEP